MSRIKYTGKETELDCRRCNQVKSVNSFYPHSTTSRGYQYWCRDCCHEERIARAKVPISPESLRKWSLKARYGMLPEDYSKLYTAQNGKCAICGLNKDSWVSHNRNQRHNYLIIDHDHNKNKVRGLLCYNCNLGIGQFKDDTTYLMKAMIYLDSYKESGHEKI